LTGARLAATSIAFAVSIVGGWARAGGRCDLDSVVGYQLVAAKPIVGYVEAGKRLSGYKGCEPDRVLVFADNTGVRCGETALQHRENQPTGYVFAKNASDLKLCVDGELFVVTQTN
jgi:hypothetical protein